MLRFSGPKPDVSEDHHGVPGVNDIIAGISELSARVREWVRDRLDEARFYDHGLAVFEVRQAGDEGPVLGTVLAPLLPELDTLA